MKDVTSKYKNMIESFECDFSLACDNESDFELQELQEQIDEKSNFCLLRDIELLKELSFNIRHDLVRIFEIE